MNGHERGMVEVHELHSDAVDDDFRILVAPCGDDPQTTLVVTDADGMFGMAVDMVRSMQLAAIVPPILIAGIAYPGMATFADTVSIRARDLTPTHMPMFSRSGGGEAFADFLATELRPWLAARYPSAARDVTYFGHSLGGLYGTHLMLTRPGLFDRYIMGSPSLWWDDELAFRTEAARAATGGDLAVAAFYGIGGLETDDGRRLEGRNLPDGHPAKPPAFYLDMVADLERFVTQLRSRNYPSLDLSAIVVDDEFHVTVPGIVLSRALRHFYH